MSDTAYQLRRVGLPATINTVKDVMRLTSEVTRFGRHSGNDYFLDSTEALLLVSRWHAEIHRSVTDAGVQYIVRDSSLNGTYVNDVRVKGNHVLKDGDTVTFGHKQGRDIEPGQYAPQPSSEFRFIFEKATEGDDASNKRRTTEGGLLPLDCLIDAGTAILSGARGGLPQQQVKRPIATPPKAEGSASGSLSALGSASSRPKMPPATSMLQRLPTPGSANKARSSLLSGAGDSSRKRASDEGSSKRGKKPKKSAEDFVDDWSDQPETAVQQRCDFYDCRLPRGDTVSWVQCDDCDKWYHTVCVGCSYEVVRNENAEFHCGCM